MKVIPAIDVQGGKCVRLLRGDFNRTTEYNDDPTAVARAFADFAVTDLHVVDLDGARTGSQHNAEAIRRITKTTPMRVQLGGGIRYASTVENWFENGVSRCVIGSLAIQEPERVKAWIRKYGADRIVLALDVAIGDDNVPMVATHGWTRTSATNLWDCLDEYVDAGLQHVLCTDISRDGAMTGPNTELYAGIVTRYASLELQASGGVRNLQDLVDLSAAGVAAAITGRAVLDGALAAEEIASFQQSA